MSATTATPPPAVLDLADPAAVADALRRTVWVFAYLSMELARANWRAAAARRRASPRWPCAPST